MKKYIVGLALGAIAGFIDVTPMVIQGLTWDANLSAFSLWIAVGLLISAVDFKMHPALKGLLVAVLVALPCAIIVGWHDLMVLIPISTFTIILGSLLGFLIDRINNRKN
ncbi:MAG: hypothetical protein AB7S48_06100 [Bacteroidales bacterium]